jgi:hypothetical protein
VGGPGDQKVESSSTALYPSGCGMEAAQGVGGPPNSYRGNQDPGEGVLILPTFYLFIYLFFGGTGI